jgi:multiple sugar transport system permease protein
MPTLPISRTSIGGPRWRMRHREALDGYLCILPWLIGFSCFTAVPLVAGLGISLTQWQILTPAQWSGGANFVRLVHDPLFWTTVYNTAYISLISVPLQLVLALGLALAMNVRLRGIAVYRLLFYLPSQTPLVASALLWLWILNPDYGLANILLGTLGAPHLQWFFDPQLSKPAIILVSLWGVGNAMMVFLAGLQGVPETLYEAAEIDGASGWVRFRQITLPMLSPVIFFNLIIGVIASFQAYFTLVYFTTDGGPVNTTLIYILYLYQKAFQDFNMGYASTLAVVLFLIVLALTAVQFRLARLWVYYESAGV